MKDNYKKVTEGTVFSFLCDIETNTNYSKVPTTIQFLMDSLSTSKHQITKYLHQLRDMGLIELTSLYFDPITRKEIKDTREINDNSLLLRGWVLTEEGKKTVTYIESANKNRNLLNF